MKQQLHSVDICFNIKHLIPKRKLRIPQILTPHFTKAFKKDHLSAERSTSPPQFAKTKSIPECLLFPPWIHKSDSAKRIIFRSKSSMAFPKNICIKEDKLLKRNVCSKWFYKTVQFQQEPVALRKSYNGFFPSTPIRTTSQIKTNKKIVKMPVVKVDQHSPVVVKEVQEIKQYKDLIQLSNVNNYKITLVKKDFPH